MRIGLNATCFNQRPSGANRRFAGIYGALIRSRPNWEFWIYEPIDCPVASWFPDCPNVRAVTTPLRSTSRLQRIVRGLGFWRARLKQDELDLFEAFNLPLIATGICPTIVTINDARSALPSEPWPQRTLSLAIHRWALRTADVVITLSETMKRELLEIEPTASVVPIYVGIDVNAYATNNNTPARRRPGLPAEYLLTVGHFEKRKNYPRLIEAMVQLRTRRSDLGLVIVGNDSGELNRIRLEIDRHNLSSTVLLLNNISDSEVIDLYRGARAVVFPSLYEGFGIPILEAMAARRPLLLSNLPVFVELTQGNGAYFPPNDSEAMALAIDGLLDNPDRQRELIAYGDKRVLDFRFETLAEQVESAYRHALANFTKRSENLN